MFRFFVPSVVFWAQLIGVELLERETEEGYDSIGVAQTWCLVQLALKGITNWVKSWPDLQVDLP